MNSENQCHQSTNGETSTKIARKRQRTNLTEVEVLEILDSESDGDGDGDDESCQIITEQLQAVPMNSENQHHQSTNGETSTKISRKRQRTNLTEVEVLEILDSESDGDGDGDYESSQIITKPLPGQKTAQNKISKPSEKHNIITELTIDQNNIIKELTIAQNKSSKSSERHDADENLRNLFTICIPSAQLIMQRKKQLEDFFPLHVSREPKYITVENFWIQFSTLYASVVEFLMKGSNFTAIIKESLEAHGNLDFLRKLIHATSILVDGMVFSIHVYIRPTTHLFQRALDAFSDISFLCRRTLIQQYQQNSLFEIIPDDIAELEFYLGFTFGLSMLETLVRNSLDDIGLGHFFAQHKESGEEPKKRTRSKCSNKQISKLNNRHQIKQVCVMCNDTQTSSVHQLKQCIGCMFFFHVTGPCFKKWAVNGDENCESGDENNWQCPVCIASFELIEVCWQNQMERIYELIVLRVASPLYRAPDIEPEKTTALHVAITQNNYDVTSMLLNGAFYLLRKHMYDDNMIPESKEKQQLNNLDQIMPSHRCWGRDGCINALFLEDCKKVHFDRKCRLTPFERGIQNSCNDLQNPPPIESLLLLAARGGGDEKLICEIPKKRRSKNYCNDDNEILPTKDISQDSERFHIPWVNETGDGEKLKADFIYINRAIESRDVVIPWFSKPLKSWENLKIETNGSFDKIALSVKKQSCSEEKQGKALKSEQLNETCNSRLIFECNYNCPCAQFKTVVLNRARRMDILQCGNRFISSGIHHCLEIFRTRYCGWGVRTCKGQMIEKDEIVCTYGGIYCSENDAKELEKSYLAQQKHSYFLNLSSKKEGKHFVVDATIFRSVSGFFNHACGDRANLKQFHLLANHLDNQLPLVGFRARERIEPLTELCFNYGDKLKMSCPKCSQKHCLCQSCMEHKCAACKLYTS